jgi:signal transduction histidine kinase
MSTDVTLLTDDAPAAARIDGKATSMIDRMASADHGVVQRYGVAVVSTLFALWLSFELHHAVQPSVYLFFYGSITIASWYGGMGPGIVASILSALGVDVLFIPPVGTVTMHEPREYAALAVFLAVTVLTSALHDSLRRARQRAQAAARAAVRAEQESSALSRALELRVKEREELLRQAERARQEAEIANRAKMSFLTTMSHELRTPLNAIAGYAQIMELGVHGPVSEAQRSDLARIQRSQRHLLALINDVLNFAKIEAGRLQITPTAIAIDAMLAGLGDLIAPQLRAKALAFEYHRCDHGLTAYADPERLRQILLNLLSNAVKFTAPGGWISIACEPDGDTVAIRVHDTGRGISASKLETIFEPFVQVERTLSEPTEGTGLGLAISRELARAMRGELWAESVEGQGSTFTVVLPRGEAVAGAVE